MERKALRSARLARHWTLAQAAERLEVDLNTLSRWERGKTRPQAYNLVKLCEIYEMTAAELGLEPDHEERNARNTLLVAPLSGSLPTSTMPDQVADPSQHAVVPDALGSSLPSASPSLVSLPPFRPQPRAPRPFRGLRRAALLLVPLLVIVISGAIGYGLTHGSAHAPDQRSHLFPLVKASTLPSPAQGTASASPTRTPGASPTGSPGASATGTVPGKPPASVPDKPTVIPQPTTPDPDCLTGSASHFTFTSVLGLGKTSSSVLTLTNCGGSTPTWVTTVATQSGGNWLEVSPSTGMLAVNGSESVQIQVVGVGLQLGTYKGSILFTKGSAMWTVAVTATVVQA